MRSNPTPSPGTSETPHADLRATVAAQETAYHRDAQAHIKSSAGSGFILFDTFATIISLLIGISAAALITSKSPLRRIALAKIIPLAQYKPDSAGRHYRPSRASLPFPFITKIEQNKDPTSFISSGSTGCSGCVVPKQPPARFP
ncbi:MAG: hypothetical protein Q9180_000723 [Flavoplaca navasiana]